MKKNFETRFDQIATILHKMGTDQKMSDYELTQIRFEIDQLKSVATNTVFGSDEDEHAFEARLDAKIAELETWEKGLRASAAEAVEHQENEVQQNKRDNVEEMEKLKSQETEPLKDETPVKKEVKMPTPTKTTKSNKK